MAPWFAGAIVALPSLLAHYPPMADLPLHEAVVGFLRHWGDPKFVPPNVYELNLVGPPNQLFYFLILALSYAVGVTWGTKLVVAATVFFLPVFCGRLADHVGATRWSAVVLAPIAIGWMYYWGLLANMIGLDVYVLAVPYLDRFCATPTRLGALKVFGWGVLLHMAHDMMALTMAGTLVVLTVCHWRGRAETLLRLLPSAGVVALALTSRVLADQIKTKYAQSMPAFYWYPLPYKVLSMPGVLYGGYTPWVRNSLGAACAAPTFLMAFDRWRHRSRALRSWRERLHHFRFEILSASLMVGFLAAPVNMSSTTLIYHRLLAPAWIVFAVAAGVGGSGWRIPRLLAAVVPIAPLLVAWPKYVETDRTYKDLDAIIDQMDEGSSSIVLELGPSPSMWLTSPVTGGGHVSARLGGRAFFDFTESPSSPVHIRTDKFLERTYARLDAHSYRFIPAYDLHRFRYVILHANSESVLTVCAMALQPEARIVAQVGQWALLESTLPLLPLDAPEGPMPEPRPPSLSKRAKETAEALRKMSEDLPPEDAPAPQVEP
jgi:hypothetical protein